MKRFKLLKSSMLLLAFLVIGVSVASAATTYYVNNDVGSDGYNGLVPEPTGFAGEGPKRTIDNAIAAAVDGDVISIANTGVTYGVLNTAGKKLTFTSSDGTPVVGGLTIADNTTFTGPIKLADAGAFALGAAVTNANNLTLGNGATVTRTTGTLDVAPVFAGKVNVYYNPTTDVTVGPELPTADDVLNDLQVNAAIKVTVTSNRQMVGQLTVVGGAKLALGGNTLTLVAGDNNWTHNVNGTIEGTAGLVITSNKGSVTFGGAGGTLPSMECTITHSAGSVTVNGPTSIDGNVVVVSGNVTLTSPAGPTGITGNLANNGTGTVTLSAALTIGGNVENTSTGVINFPNANVTVKGNVSNSGALSNTTNTQKTGQGNINFGSGVNTINGAVTNSASFSGTTNNKLGGFANCGNITFANAGNAVVIDGKITNGSTSSFTTETGTLAGVFSDNGNITFGNTTGDATFKGGVQNNSSGFGFAGTNAMGAILIANRGTGTVTVGLAAANADVVNNSANTGGDNGTIDLGSAGTGTITVNGNVTAEAGNGEGDILFGTGGTTVTGTVKNARATDKATIVFNETANNVTLGALESTGSGVIEFKTTTGAITSNGNVTVGGGTVKTASTTGGITIKGSYVQTGGKLEAKVLMTGPVAFQSNYTMSGGTCDLTASGASSITVTGNFVFTGGTLGLGAGARNFTISGASAQFASGVTFTGGTNTTLIFNRNISGQTLTSATGVTWPGNLEVNNTFPVVPTWTLAGNMFVVNGNVKFAAGGAPYGVDLGNYQLVVKGNFVNNSGYTGGANGFVSMQGTALQTISGTADFYSIEVDNAAGANFDDGTAAAVTYTVTGALYLTNGTVGVGAGPDVISLNNATTYPTIVRNAGGFAAAPTFTSKVNVTYIGGSKTFSNEVPGAGTDKLANLTVATTGASTVTANINFDFLGVLKINDGQTLDIGAQTVTSKGTEIVSNGKWSATTGKIILARAAGTAITAKDAIPEVQVNDGSTGNSITGAKGITGNLTLAGAGNNTGITVAFVGDGPHIGGNVVTTGTKDVLTLASNVIVTGNLNHGGGSVNLDSYTLTLKGTAPVVSNGTTISGTGKLVLNGTGAGQTLTVNGGAASIAANIELKLDAAGSDLKVQTNDLSLGGEVTLTMGKLDIDAGRTVTLTGSALNLTGSSSVTGTGILKFKPASKLVVTLAGATSFANLTVDGNTQLAGEAGTLTVTNLVHSNGELDFAARDIKTTNYTRTGGTYVATTGKLIVTTTFKQGTGFTIPNLGIENTGVSVTGIDDKDFSVTKQFTLDVGAGNTFNIKPGTVIRMTLGDGTNAVEFVHKSGDMSDLAPVAAGSAFNMTYGNTNDIKVSKKIWPKERTVDNLKVAGTAKIEFDLDETRNVTSSIDLISGTLETSTKDGAKISLADSATITRRAGTYLKTKGGIVYEGKVNMVYAPVANIGSGDELPSTIQDLTFTRTGNIANTTVTLNKDITVNGTLTIKNDVATNDVPTVKTITAKGDVVIATDSYEKATNPSITLGALAFGGDVDQTFDLNNLDRNITNLTIDKTNATNKVTIANGNLTVNAMLTFKNGLLVTGTNYVELTNATQGYNRTGVTGSNVSHVVGTVMKPANGGRQEFPVGTETQYRPVAITNVATTAGNLYVTHVGTSPEGTAGLPIKDGVATGIDVARYPDFYWSIKSDVSTGANQFNLELTAGGFTDYEPIALVRMIRRFEGNISNPWSLQGTNYDNYVVNGIPTVTSVNCVGGISPVGTRFAYGLKSNLFVANPIADQTIIVVDTLSISLSKPPVFGGNEGALTYEATSSNEAIATASIVSGDTLLVTPVAAGTATITVKATDINAASIETTFDVTISPVGIVKEPAIPEDYCLNQNYPNPFNPTTNITFGLPKESNVTIDVYNLMGQKVVTLVNERINAGYHTVNWNGRDASGNLVTSGFYIYRMTAGNFIKTNKMMFLK